MDRTGCLVREQLGGYCIGPGRDERCFGWEWAVDRERKGFKRRG